ncbi:MAG: hypothetical protein M0021_08715 [Clostridia bacterium]|nr:hypothetical protein [Clostridia bacterium]
MPNLKNILVEPAAKPVTDQEIKPGYRQAVLQVTGLLCYTL